MKAVNLYFCWIFGHKYKYVSYNRWFIPTERICSRCGHEQVTSGLFEAMERYGDWDNEYRWKGKEADCETRPEPCRVYAVGNPSCLAAIKRFNPEKEKEIVEAMK